MISMLLLLCLLILAVLYRGYGVAQCQAAIQVRELEVERALLHLEWVKQLPDSAVGTRTM